MSILLSLLVGNMDGSILLYDTQDVQESPDGGSVFPKVAHLTTVPSSILPSRLQSSSSMGPSVCLQWNPVDTGSFINVALDKTLKIWDTNRAEVC